MGFTVGLAIFDGGVIGNAEGGKNPWKSSKAIDVGAVCGRAMSSGAPQKFASVALERTSNRPQAAKGPSTPVEPGVCTNLMQAGTGKGR
mmetsp:Transcript_45951/g.86181  ORF Transcript_45951/g.86181 Transcript_45951/m.86181 type:complete len:89 (+) Transcript_45951:331-597(+)